MIEINITPKKPKINIDISEPTKEIDVDIGAPHSGSGYPIYDGSTTAVPLPYEMQILQTQRKIVLENIMVLPIPYFVTSNPYGGNTVYIGE